MLAALEDVFGVPAYLIRMIDSYLRDRERRFDTADGRRSRQITGGDDHGSIMGYVLYDGILRMQMPEDTFLVVYTNDIAAVITARNTLQ